MDRMKPFVHSNYKRIKNDNYQTVDKRCIYGFLQHFIPHGLCVDVCSPDGSEIVDTLKECGFNAVGLSDAFAEIKAEWIITNPPYMRSIVDKIIHKQIDRVRNADVYGVAILLRSNFDFAKSRKEMFKEFYYGQIKLCFRPWWSTEHKKQPIHNYVWHIWMCTPLIQPVVMYSSGDACLP